MMGFYHPTAGRSWSTAARSTIASPQDASALGLGMVYQHFTLVPSLTGAENLVISREDVPAIIDWGKERKALAAFMETMPFSCRSTCRCASSRPARSRSWRSSSSSISAGAS